MKEIKLLDFLLWYLSDENSEGVKISDKAINHINDYQFNQFQNIFEACVVVPCRLVNGDNSVGDYKVNEEVILIR